MAHDPTTTPSAIDWTALPRDLWFKAFGYLQQRALIALNQTGKYMQELLKPAFRRAHAWSIADRSEMLPFESVAWVVASRGLIIDPKFMRRLRTRIWYYWYPHTPGHTYNAPDRIFSTNSSALADLVLSQEKCSYYS
jgi:hypothetical protein